MNLILGAGISGISAGYHMRLAGQDAVIFEQNNSWGGLCDNFELGGFRFDYAIHLSFTKNEYVKNIFSKSCNCYSHEPHCSSYYKGYWLKHPAQNNLYPLGIGERAKVLHSLIKKRMFSRKRPDISNYEEWLKYQYGDYFAENFPMEYTKKYWTVPAASLTTEWIGCRMRVPTLKEVLIGAVTSKTSNMYYADEMRYPEKGGFRSFLTHMADRCSIRLNKKVVLVDTKQMAIEFSDGSREKYERLISSLPLPEIIGLIKDCPDEIRLFADKLAWTSVGLVSLGFRRPDIPRSLWFYIYDKDVMASRVCSPSINSVDNVPAQCSSLQFEIYYSKYKPLDIGAANLIDRVIRSSVKMSLFERQDVVIEDFRTVRYANIIFDKDMAANRFKIHTYLNKIGIECIGRFGKWDYLWSDQSLLTGKAVAEN